MPFRCLFRLMRIKYRKLCHWFQQVQRKVFVLFLFVKSLKLVYKHLLIFHICCKIANNLKDEIFQYLYLVRYEDWKFSCFSQKSALRICNNIREYIFSFGVNKIYIIKSLVTSMYLFSLRRNHNICNTACTIIQPVVSKNNWMTIFLSRLS